MAARSPTLSHLHVGDVRHAAPLLGLTALRRLRLEDSSAGGAQRRLSVLPSLESVECCFSMEGCEEEGGESHLQHAAAGLAALPLTHLFAFAQLLGGAAAGGVALASQRA